MKRQKNLLLLFALLASLMTYSQQGWDLAKEIEKNIIPPTFLDKDYCITDFGAKEGGVIDAREAINRAIFECSFNGGGRVIVPPGKWFVKGSIFFKSNVNLHLKEGSELIFSYDEKDYLPAVLTRWEGTELFNYSPLVYAYSVSNIALTGKGTLNGQGSKNFATWRPSQRADQLELRRMGREGVPVYQRVFGDGHRLRPQFVNFMNSNNVLIEDVNIIDATFWVIHLVNCENVTVRGVTMYSFNHNSDGVDPESSRNVLIENCHFRTGDDAIAIKSGRDQDGWRLGQPTENVIIRNSIFETQANGVCIGSEIGGGVRNIFVENIKMPNTNSAIYFKSNLDRGGYVENVWIRNIEMDTINNVAIRFEPDYKSESQEQYPTIFRNITIENVVCHWAKRGIDMQGFAGLPLQNITLRNIDIQSADIPFVIANAEEVTFENVRINGEEIILDEQFK
ncbi:MAG: glycoside hydrolase family 28 protein [Dysgonamonadaceae bacterium]|nr:glycoside hydrolase family 28 protein [Dysgonamonadaceae bacterium]